MTSMPASRRARAITLAPRSWPSSPGLATSTRILRSVDIWVRFYQTSPQRHGGTEASTEETISGSCLAMAWRFQPKIGVIRRAVVVSAEQPALRGGQENEAAAKHAC